MQVMIQNFPFSSSHLKKCYRTAMQYCRTKNENPSITKTIICVAVCGERETPTFVCSSSSPVLRRERKMRQGKCVAPFACSCSKKFRLMTSQGRDYNGLFD